MTWFIRLLTIIKTKIFLIKIVFKNELLFFTFVAMKNSQNPHIPNSGNTRKNRSLSKMQRIIFSIKSIRNFDIFLFTNPLHEKLQIMYANIRVWKVRYTKESFLKNLLL